MWTRHTDDADGEVRRRTDVRVLIMSAYVCRRVGWSTITHKHQHRFTNTQHPQSVQVHQHQQTSVQVHQHPQTSVPGLKC